MTRRSRRWGERCVNAVPSPIRWYSRNAAMCRPIARSVDKRAITSSFATDCRKSGSRPSSARRHSTTSVMRPSPRRSHSMAMRPITSTRRNNATSRAANCLLSRRSLALRWYWALYKQSDHWLGDLSVGQEGLSHSTRLQRTGLIEWLLPENGEKPFGVLTRKVIKAEMKARTPSQAGNLLSALRGMIRWMIDEGHLDEDDDPTIGLKSGKAKASRETGGFLPWTEDDMAVYRAKWPLGTEARLMFDILHYTFLRLGDAHRFGSPHLRQIVRKMAVQIATEKSRGNTVPVHPSLRRACGQRVPPASSAPRFLPARS